MSAILELNRASREMDGREPRASVVDLVGRRRWLTTFLVAKSREGWLFFWNTSGSDPPSTLRA
jgi:hypothetical protein